MYSFRFSFCILPLFFRLHFVCVCLLIFHFGWLYDKSTRHGKVIAIEIENCWKLCIWFIAYRMCVDQMFGWIHSIKHHAIATTFLSHMCVIRGLYKMKSFSYVPISCIYLNICFELCVYSADLVVVLGHHSVFSPLRARIKYSCQFFQTQQKEEVKWKTRRILPIILHWAHRYTDRIALIGIKIPRLLWHGSSSTLFLQ